MTEGRSSVWGKGLPSGARSGGSSATRGEADAEGAAEASGDGGGLALGGLALGGLARLTAGAAGDGAGAISAGAAGATVATGAPEGAGSPRHWQKKQAKRAALRRHRSRIRRSSIVEAGAQRPIVRHILRDGFAAHDRYLARRHLPGLDGLRCLAILPVIWHHATPRLLPGVLGKGAVGVDLFFALSGFLITTLLLREQREQGTISLRAFYARRSLRIFPLYYAVLAAYALRESLHPELPSAAHFLHGLPYHATYTANWFLSYDVPHPVVFAFSWSLCVEEQFYWVWPGLVALVRRRLPLALLMMLAMLLDYAAEHGFFGAQLAAGSTAARMATSFATPIGCGALAALALDSRTGFSVARLCLGWRGAAPTLLLASIGWLLVPATPYVSLSLTLAALVFAGGASAADLQDYSKMPPDLAARARICIRRAPISAPRSASATTARSRSAPNIRVGARPTMPNR